MANIDLYMQKLVDIANSIRNKLNETDQYTLEEMPGKIDSIRNKIISKSISDNGTYYASSDNADGYNPVVVNLPLSSKSITTNGTYNASQDNLKGYSSVTVNVQPALLEKTVTTNGTYTAALEGYYGYSKVIVNLALGEKTVTTNGTYYASSDSLKGYSKFVVNVPPAVLGTKSITENGTYAASSDSLDGYSSVTVNVQPTLKTKSITLNGTYKASDERAYGYSQVTVNVQPALLEKIFRDNGTYTASTEGVYGYSKVTVALALDEKSITANGEYLASGDSLKGYSKVTVDVQPNLMEKTITSNGTYTAVFEGVQGYSKVVVNLALGTKNITANGTYNASTDSLKGYSKVTVSLALGTKSITANGTYSASSDSLKGFSSVTVAVPSEGMTTFSTDLIPSNPTQHNMQINSKSEPQNAVVYRLHNEHLKKLSTIRLKGTIYGKTGHSSYPVTAELLVVLPAHNPSTANHQFGYYNPSTDTFTLDNAAGYAGSYYDLGSAYQAWSKSFSSTSYVSEEIDYTLNVSSFLTKLNNAGYTLLPNNAVYYKGWTITSIDNSIALILRLSMLDSTNSIYGYCYMTPPSGGKQLTLTYT